MVPAARLWARLLARRDPRIGRPWVVAVDGRSGSGKSTLAGVLAATAPLPAETVHTDDIAWHHSFFGWDGMLAEHVLAPARAGRSVRFVPPAWRERGRGGAITVSAACGVLIIEGVGSSRRSLAPFRDVSVYVQVDTQVARRRLLARDGHTAESRAFIADWEREEGPLLAAELPWAHADAVLAGSPPPDLRPADGAADRLVVGHAGRSAG